MRLPEEIEAELRRLRGIANSWKSDAEASVYTLIMIDVLQNFGTSTREEIDKELTNVARVIRSLPCDKDGKIIDDIEVRVRGVMLLWVLGRRVSGIGESRP